MDWSGLTAGVTGGAGFIGSHLVDKLMDDAQRGSNAVLTVDLENQVINGPDGGEIAFEVDPFRKRCLLEGLDDIGLTMEKASNIDAFEARARAADRLLAVERRVADAVEPAGQRLERRADVVVVALGAQPLELGDLLAVDVVVVDAQHVELVLGGEPVGVDADQLLGVAAGALRAEHSLAQTDKSFFPAGA